MATTAEEAKPRPREGRTRRERREARRVRTVVQALFLALSALLVWEYHRFIGAALADARALPARPDGAEAFIPIAAVVSLVHLLKTGEWDPVHPAALAILLAALATALLLRKAFCSWVCPVGAVSEWLGDAGHACWDGTARLPGWLDKPLLGVKYLFLGFFLFGIARVGDYYYHQFDRHADIGMYGYWFWGRFGPTMVVFATFMAIWSTVSRIPWCRYLCPYGALLGIFSRFSPVRITRNATRCTGCGQCARRCPAAIPVDRLAVVRNAECTACLACTAACPVRDTLHLQAGRRRLRPRHVAVLVLGLFFGTLAVAMQTGHWHTSIPAEEYRSIIRQMRWGGGMPHRF